MKTLILFISILYSTVDSADSYSFDGIKIGTPIDQFLKVCVSKNRVILHRKINPQSENIDYYEVYNQQNRGVYFSVEPICDNKKDCIVGRILIYNKDFKTKEGIGTGSSLGELKSKYTLKIFITEVGREGLLSEEVKRVGIVVEETKLCFFLDADKIPKLWWKNQSLAALKDNLLIIMIRIS